MSVTRMPYVGALLSENARLHVMLQKLKKNVRKVKLLNKWLNKEVQVQAKVISQHDSLLKKTQAMRKGEPSCKSGHKWCKVDHAMYKYVNKAVPDKMLSSRSQCSRSIKQESLGPSNFLGNDSLVKMSKKIDDLQSRYGVPPVGRQNASKDLIHPVFSDIWENVLSFKHNVLEKAERIEKVEPLPIFKSKKMALNFGSSIILETRP